ncbi:MAG: DUF1854 domain-containing protein [Planctomycetaceae bacterium]|nr:DUF1854 domain-containing protein [Planctomycetaceae bacterium]
MTTSTPVAGALSALADDAWGRLVATLSDGSQHVGVEPIRAFPWTDRHEWVVLVNAEGHEVACLATLSEVPAAVRTRLEQALAAREFVPVIEQIEKATHPYPPCVWTVSTNRGPATVSIDSEDDVRRLSDGKVLIADSTGLRYQIAQVQQLDAASQRHLRRLL